MSGQVLTMGGSLHRRRHLSAAIWMGVRSMGSSGFRRPGDRIGETTVFLQSGRKISELPLVVKKVNDIFQLYSKLGLKPVTSSDLQPTEEDKFILCFPVQLSEEEREIIDGFNRCFTASSIFRLLETIPRAEVTPCVAAHALRKIIDLENNLEFRNPGAVRETIKGVVKKQDTFLRIAFISMLLEIVCSSRNPNVILDGLATVMRDQFPADLATYKERLLEELLLCVTEGIFNLKEICRAIHILSLFYEDKKKCLETADKLWFGIVDQSSQLEDPDSIVSVFSILPHLAKSRSIIMKILESKAVEQWQKYSSADILEILRVLVEMKYDSISPSFLKMISSWLAVNIHQVKESELLAIVYSLHQLDYMDDQLVCSLEKVVRLRGCTIQEPDLVPTICEACCHFRIRSPTLLEGASQYFLHHADKLTVPQILSIAKSFGTLDFHPSEGFKFWETTESLLEAKFVQFRPFDVIQLLVSFLYIQKFPLNLTSRLFNPYFLDRLHSQQEEDIAISRRELKLFDAAMKLECRAYGGPYLPRDKHHRSIELDSRIRRLAAALAGPLSELVGGDLSRLGSQVVLSSLPLHPLYIVDVMIYPSQAATLLRFGFKTDNSDTTAVLILTPEHYDRTGQHLVGSQAMRVRHLRLMGFRVMVVNQSKASRLLMHPRQLREYLQVQYRQALTHEDTATK